MAYCTHQDCRASAAVELAYMAVVLNRLDLLVLARAALVSEARCRRALEGPEAHLPWPDA